MYIDTHCHLNFKAFTGGEHTIIQKAHDACVHTMIVPGTDVPTSNHAVHIAQNEAGVYALVGIHPHHATSYLAQEDPIHTYTEDLLVIESLLTKQCVVGVGEIGLDRHTYVASKYGPARAVDERLFALQMELFKRQLSLAHTYQKPVAIHNREATRDIVHTMTEMIVNHVGLPHIGVFHCCEADPDMAGLAQRMGWYIGVDGDVTYDQKKQMFIRSLPLEMLVLETDAPYLVPEPLRSQKKYPNTPANIPLIADHVAHLKGTSKDEVARITSQNARRLFGLPE